MSNNKENQKDKIEVETVYQLFSSLDDEGRKEFIARIINDFQKPDTPAEEKPEENTGSMEKFLFERKSEDGLLPCPHCGCQHIVKFGRTKKGRQRFRCKGCGRTFVLTTGTVLYYTHKKLDTWKNFIDCMMEKKSLRKCAGACKINPRTAFFWRHKILDTLRLMMDDVTLNGVVEADETFVLLSFKGNHEKDGLELPREPFKRGGTASKNGLSDEQVCVPVGINLDGLSIGKISNLGKPGLIDLRNVLGGRVAEESIFVTDSLRPYVKLSEEMGLYHYPIKPGKRKNGTFNIQMLNNYHGQFKDLINHRFHGVSTKHLNNYIVYHNFVNYSKGTEDEKRKILTDYSLAEPIDVRTGWISKRNPIPVLE